MPGELGQYPVICTGAFQGCHQRVLGSVVEGNVRNSSCRDCLRPRALHGGLAPLLRGIWATGSQGSSKLETDGPYTERMKRRHHVSPGLPGEPAFSLFPKSVCSFVESCMQGFNRQVCTMLYFFSSFFRGIPKLIHFLFCVVHLSFNIIDEGLKGFFGFGFAQFGLNFRPAF